MTHAKLWAVAMVAGLVVASYACFGDVYGGTHPPTDDCEYGCEMTQEEPPHAWGTPATSSDGGRGGGGYAGAAGAAGHGGSGGAAGAAAPGGQGGQAGQGGD